MPRRVLAAGTRPAFSTPARTLLRSPFFLLIFLGSVVILSLIIAIAKHKSECSGGSGPRHDFLFLSYPKAGRTWLRYLVGQALYHAYLPATKFMTVDDILLGNFPTGALNFTYAFAHSCDELHRHPFSQTKQEALRDTSYRGQNVILLLRDPRDVAVSAWFEARYRYHPRMGFPSNIPFEEFVTAPVGGYRTVIGYYQNWAHNVSRLSKKSLAIKYEDLKVHPDVYLTEVIKFMGLKNRVKNEDIQWAVAESSFEKMHKLEQEGKFQSYKMKPYDRNNPDSFKVRKGVIGVWKEHATEKVKQFFSHEKCHCRWYK